MAAIHGVRPLNWANGGVDVIVSRTVDASGRYSGAMTSPCRVIVFVALSLIREFAVKFEYFGRPCFACRRRPGRSLRHHRCDGATVTTVPGMPPVTNVHNMYSNAGFNDFSPAVAGALPRIYVPNLRSNDVYVIDPATFKVVGKFPVGHSPQHVVPSWDLQTLWVTNIAEHRI